MAKREIVVLKFTQSHLRYVPGDVAGFSPAEAEEILATSRGGRPVARLRVPPGERQEQGGCDVETKAMTGPPADKMQRPRGTKTRGAKPKAPPRSRGSGGKSRRGK